MIITVVNNLIFILVTDCRYRHVKHSSYSVCPHKPQIYQLHRLPFDMFLPFRFLASFLFPTKHEDLTARCVNTPNQGQTDGIFFGTNYQYKWVILKIQRAWARLTVSYFAAPRHAIISFLETSNKYPTYLLVWADSAGAVEVSTAKGRPHGILRILRGAESSPVSDAVG